MGDELAVSVRNLRFAYPARNIEVIHGLDIEVRRGQIVAILGGSGCGKSTVLSLVNGQNEMPDNGSQVTVLGQDMKGISNRHLFALRRKVGMMFQVSSLFTGQSVFDNVAFPLREHTELSELQITDLVMLKLHAVGLRSAARRFPSELSGGQRRRVELARAVALDPELMLYDEPFTGLDPISLAVSRDLIRDLNFGLGATSRVITHDVAETFAIADYVYVMWQGKVVSRGTPRELAASDQPLTRQFVKGETDGPLPFHMPGRSFAEDLRLHEPAEAA